jgi:hypothetical protein
MMTTMEFRKTPEIAGILTTTAGRIKAAVGPAFR